MLAKLGFRNMKRSMRDYTVYMLTMTLITALMYAFNSLIFQNELIEQLETDSIMEMMIGFATFFIMLIVVWLIHYMVRFMLEKRSGEFGIYLLLGMKKRTISRLYMQENLLLGGVSFLAGILFGVLLQQVLMTVMFAMVRMEYRLHISFHKGTILMTALCYGGCFLLALLRCRRKFKKMSIQSLMNARRQNEEIREKKEEVKRILFPLSVIFILMFWRWFGGLESTEETLVFLTGLVLTIYLFYIGISAWIICYVRGKGEGIYKGQNLFLLRQFASKIRTMQFTMGTLTALFTLALIGASIALMFSEYENTVLDDKFPFDIQIWSGDTENDFAAEKKVIEENAKVREYFAYHIYTDEENRVNTFVLTHTKNYGTIFWAEDGSPDGVKIKNFLQNQNVYYEYDTYMGISDYNHLRKMLGYGEVRLNPDEFLVQVKPRLAEEFQEICGDMEIWGAQKGDYLKCAGVCGDSFSQDGHNGADYVIVVPDTVLKRMKPYYLELAVKVSGGVSKDLRKKLDALLRQEDLAFAENPGLEDLYEEDMYEDGNFLRCGSDNIINYAVENLVRDNLIPEVKYMLASLIIPLFYIGLVFVCVAVTVLSVQQLSDSAKYRYRYDVLAKLGLERGQINRLILKQLSAYYLCPALLAVIISGKMILYASRIFVEMTGVPASPIKFFARSILLFFSIYLIYFMVTYVSFKRNVEEKIAGK